MVFYLLYVHSVLISITFLCIFLITISNCVIQLPRSKEAFTWNWNIPTNTNKNDLIELFEKEKKCMNEYLLDFAFDLFCNSQDNSFFYFYWSCLKILIIWFLNNSKMNTKQKKWFALNLLGYQKCDLKLCPYRISLFFFFVIFVHMW